MKILVTGMNSRQANPEAGHPGAKEVSFARTLAETLRGAGHHVEHRNPQVEEDLSDFDHVFLGLAPLHALGSNRMYGALSVALRTWATDKLTLFADDQEVVKIAGGLATMVNDPGRLVKPFFAYKLEYAIANSPEYSGWLNHGVRMLHEQQWPRLLLPAHPWFEDLHKIEKKLPQAAGQIETLDLTSCLPKIAGERDAEDDESGVKMQWISEAAANNKWLKQQRPVLPIYRVWRKDLEASSKALPDAHLVKLYSTSWGVLQPPEEPAGFWKSRIGYARQAGVPFLTRWQDVRSLGEPYTLLPETVANMTMEDRFALVDAQAAALDAAVPSRDEIVATLNQIIGVKESV